MNTFMHHTFKQWLLPILILLPLLGLYLYHIVTSYSYDSDFARDMFDMLSIAQGDFRLLGPKLSFGGIHSGPYYYYLFAPLLFVFPDQPEAVLYTNAILAWFAVVGIYFLLKQVWRSSAAFSALAAYVLGLSPVLLFSARQPGNAFTYQPWFVVLLLLLPVILKTNKIRWWLVYGLGWGILLNFHFVLLLVIAAFSFSFLFIRRHKIKQSLVAVLVFGIGMALSFSPVILFDLTHGMVQFKNTFIDKSYQAFTTNTNLPSPMPTSDNVMTNFIYLQKYVSQWLYVPLIYILSFVLIFGWQKRRTLDDATKVIVLSSGLAFVLLVVTARSQMAIHYLFPTASLTLVAAVVVLKAVDRQIGLAVLAAAIITSCLLMPSAWFQKSSRQIAEFRSAAQSIITSEMGQKLAATPYNVYVTREISLAPLGWEYRYFFLTKGLKPLDPSAYNQAQLLIWIAEQPKSDFLSTQSWELDQFGPRTVDSETMVQGRKILLFNRLSVD